MRDEVVTRMESEAETKHASPSILHPSSFILLLILPFLVPPSSLLLSSPADSPVQFVEIASQAGLAFRHENGASAEKLMPETFGSGVAWIDYDNDGWIDLFFPNGADLARSKASPGNALFRNLRNGKFANVTEKAGVAGRGLFATGAAVGDYDNDGFQDLFVTGYGGVQLLHNNGNGSFTDVSQKAGVTASGWSSSTGWLDYDRDGYLDLYVVRYLDYDIKNAPYCGFNRSGYRMYCDPQQFDGVPDLLFRNNHDGTFTDVSRQAGISNRSGKGLGVSLGDVDKDGLTDIFVTNDGIRNFLYRNKGDGTFGDVAYEACVGFDTHGKPMAGMGTEIADYDEDGNPDIFMTAFSREYNTLFRNLGKLIFEDVTATVGIESGFLTLAFGAKLFDYDNDGDLDIYATNGHVTDNVELYDGELSYRQKDLLYENTNGSFVDISSQSGPAFQVKHVGRGAAIGDFDNDGDLDIVVADCGGPPLLMRNDGGNRNNWIGIQARGKESNRFGIGAKVRVTSAGRTRLREINIAGSYLSSSDVRLFFGLGSETKAERVEIEWPSRKKQTLENVPARQILQLDESNAK
ncbi:MAG: CRTAC1 family protein [Acidobacteria bacterium]|nr:MAG: CRTAC1 family protein [Acidobacteriota bacterium]